MKTIINFFQKIFQPSTYASELENYILSKNPQNTAHIEALEREFAVRQNKLWSC